MLPQILLNIVHKWIVIVYATIFPRTNVGLKFVVKTNFTPSWTAIATLFFYQEHSVISVISCKIPIQSSYVVIYLSHELQKDVSLATNGIYCTERTAAPNIQPLRTFLTTMLLCWPENFFSHPLCICSLSSRALCRFFAKEEAKIFVEFEKFGPWMAFVDHVEQRQWAWM